MSAAADTLAELQEVARAAREREIEMAAEARRCQRELTSALFAREALDRATGAGEAPDPDEEERLAELLGAPGVETRRLDPGGRAVVDTRAEARLEGAREALAEAESAVREHVRSHLDELLHAASEGASEARDKLVEAVASIEAAETDWRTISTRAARLLALAAADELEAQELRADLDASGWRMPPVPIALDGQQVADYEAAMQGDPDALLPISRAGADQEEDAA